MDRVASISTATQKSCLLYTSDDNAVFGIAAAKDLTYFFACRGLETDEGIDAIFAGLRYVGLSRVEGHGALAANIDDVDHMDVWVIGERIFIAIQALVEVGLAEMCIRDRSDAGAGNGPENADLCSRSPWCSAAAAGTLGADGKHRCLLYTSRCV